MLIAGVWVSITRTVTQLPNEVTLHIIALRVHLQMTEQDIGILLFTLPMSALLRHP